MSEPTIEFRCTHCGAVERDQALAPGRALACRACGRDQPFDGEECLGADGTLEACPSCGTREFYVQRDFNRRVGLAMVILAVLLAWPTKGISLAALVVFDLVLHRMLSPITVCYKCAAIVRGTRRNPRHEGFDMAVEDKYRAIRDGEALEANEAAEVALPGAVEKVGADGPQKGRV